MQTQCPHCQTVFRLAEEHIASASGNVRCGQCGRVFNANSRLLPEEPEADANEVNEVEEDMVDESEAEISEEELNAELAEMMRQEHSSQQRGVLGGLAWAVLLLAMTVLLAAQGLWYLRRDVVLQNPQLRPALESLCAALACALPSTHDLTQIQVTQRFVDQHKDNPNASLAHIIFVNNAPFPQPYPILQLTFSDEKNQMVGGRRFTPQEYVQDPKADLQQLPPQTPVHVKLEFNNLVKSMHTYGFAIQFL